MQMCRLKGTFRKPRIASIHWAFPSPLSSPIAGSTHQWRSHSAGCNLGLDILQRATANSTRRRVQAHRAAALYVCQGTKRPNRQDRCAAVLLVADALRTMPGPLPLGSVPWRRATDILRTFPWWRPLRVAGLRVSSPLSCRRMKECRCTANQHRSRVPQPTQPI